jgi:hypothetical protein
VQEGRGLYEESLKMRLFRVIPCLEETEPTRSGARQSRLCWTGQKQSEKQGKKRPQRGRMGVYFVAARKLRWHRRLRLGPTRNGFIQVSRDKS